MREKRIRGVKIYFITEFGGQSRHTACRKGQSARARIRIIYSMRDETISTRLA